MHDPRITAALLRKETLLRPTLAMVLGSGFQHTLGEFDPALELAYGQLPGFPTVGVTGHAGTLVFGHFDHIPVVIAGAIRGAALRTLSLGLGLWLGLTLSIELLAQGVEGILRVFRRFLDTVDVVALRGLLQIIDLAFDRTAFRRRHLVAQLA